MGQILIPYCTEQSRQKRVLKGATMDSDIEQSSDATELATSAVLLSLHIGGKWGRARCSSWCSA